MEIFGFITVQNYFISNIIKIIDLKYYLTV